MVLIPIPIVYEIPNDAYYTAFVLPEAEITVITEYNDGSIVGILFYDSVDYRIDNASYVKNIYFIIKLDGKSWKLQPKIIPLTFLPLIFNE